MRILSITRISLLAGIIFSLFSCKKQTEEFKTDALSDYIPLVTGKYITYRVDSTVFTNFGKNTEVHSYQINHVIESQITDNLGRPSYRVFRYLRDTAGIQPWQPAGSYFITPLSNQVEVIEDNLRFIKLHLPIKKGYTWKGNTYLPTDPYGPLYTFSNDDNMEDWDYTISDMGESTSINGTIINDVLTIDQVDEKILVDTFNVTTGNLVQIPANNTSVWITGSATGIITVNAAAPSKSLEMRIYNFSNNSLKLNGIATPAGSSRNYLYNNGQWGFGDNGKDTLYTDLPYGSKTYSIEKYAKNTGLVFKEYELWEYQPNTGYPGGPYKTGFGVKMWMINHN